MEESRVAQLPWKPLGSLPSDIAQRDYYVLQFSEQRLISLEPALVPRLHQKDEAMKVGDLVKIDWAQDGDIGIVLALHTNETATVHFVHQGNSYELWRERLEIISE